MKRRKKSYKRYTRHSKKDKSKLYRGIALVVVGLLLILWTLSYNWDESREYDNKDDEFCYVTCDSICHAKDTNLTIYHYREGGCDCTCSDRTNVIFGMDHKGN